MESTHQLISTGWLVFTGDFTAYVRSVTIASQARGTAMIRLGKAALSQFYQEE
ncbi:hypothetical protein C1H46_009944 [Malus baccata]|uniref:Uncharacterized protein n=1 Tax=Malus baccata TaxID=106549 RepID=A0A540N085_MALBA|nr:hypothetical protein C1H46_009944 [Malus baccata]